MESVLNMDDAEFDKLCAPDARSSPLSSRVFFLVAPLQSCMGRVAERGCGECRYGPVSEDSEEEIRGLSNAGDVDEKVDPLIKEIVELGKIDA
eukprot:2396460-Rhodomonas_salina.1